MQLRELADTGFVSVQNFVKLGLYLKKWYDKQQGFLISPDLEIQELDLSKEVAQKWTGFTPFLSSPPFLCYGVYFDFSQQLFTKSEVFCKYSTQTGFHKILKKYKVPVCQDS